MNDSDMTAPVTKVTRALAALVLAAACGGSSALSGDPATTSAPPAATTGTSVTSAPSAAASTGAIAKASANNATNTQLVAALTAAGVPNPANWAREVQEYRPYDASDTNMTKLRQNLAKYNPAAGVVDKIISALSLP